MTRVINEGRRAFVLLAILIPICLGIQAVMFFFADMTIYIVGLMTLGWIGAFIIDLVLAWTGCFSKFRGASIASFIGLSLLCIGIPFALTEDDSVVAFGASLLFWLISIFGIVLGSVIFPTSPAVYILRSSRGLRSSGDPADAIVVCNITGEFGKMFGEKVFRLQLEGLVSSVVHPVSRLVYDDKALAENGIRLLRANEAIAFYRYEENVIEVLLVPIDGIVARFEKAEEHTLALKFMLFRLMGCYPAGVAAEEDGRNRILQSYRMIASRPHRVRVPAIYLAVWFSVGVTGGYLIANRDAVWTALVDEDISRGLVSIAAVGAIFAMLLGAGRWLLKRAKPPM